MARKKKSEVTNEMLEPVVVKGSHLTVTTYPDGRTELEWDDEALERDVRNALTEYEKSVKVNTTETKKPKSSKKQK